MLLVNVIKLEETLSYRNERLQHPAGLRQLDNNKNTCIFLPAG